jgi:chloride channel protein, CIC family
MTSKPWYQALRKQFEAALDDFRLNASRPDALVQLSLLGILTGLITGGVIVAFLWAIRSGQGILLPGDGIEPYDALDPWMRFALPVAGGIAIGLAFKFFSKGQYVVGVIHVMERLAYHQGRMPLRALIMQFVGATLAIVSGHSVGREGPGVHLGAASGSLLGSSLRMPNNSLRTLAGCGTAASIAASFNTPLAGVIFALEVVMLDYTLASFLPVILAAVTATAVSVAIFGPEPVFSIPFPEMNTLLELPYILLLGIVVGAFSSAFIQLTRLTARHAADRDFLLRTTSAGVIVGLIALMFPQVMGIGYATVNAALLGEAGLAVLIGVAVFKLIATSFAVGLGVPGGLIGPTLLIGATLGGFLGIISTYFSPEQSSGAGFYALLGLGAMMGATLQAPLAALTAMMELSSHPGIIFPGMLAIAAASLTSSQVFRTPSVYRALLRARGLDYRSNPVMAALRRVGVGSTMDRSFVRTSRHLARNQVDAVLAGRPRWVLVDEDGDPAWLLPTVDLLSVLQEDNGETLDLIEIPAQRRQVGAINREADMGEARDRLAKGDIEALYVRHVIAPGIWRVDGVLTRERVEASYRP